MSRILSITCAVLCGVLLGAPLLRAGQNIKFPTKEATSTFPAAMTVALATDQGTNCVVLLTGQVTMHNLATVTGPTNSSFQVDIVSLDLTGIDPILGPVRLLAGTNAVGTASRGLVSNAVSTAVFPANIYIDTFVRIELASGTNLVNTQALRLETSLATWPPISQTLTNAGPVVLVDAADTNRVAGTVTQVGLSGAEEGNGTVLALSADVSGFQTPGAATISACTTTGVASTARLNITNVRLAGLVDPHPGCDQFLPTNLLFNCDWTMDLRLPDWRGTHTGNWILYSIDPKGETVLFAYGKMYGSSGAGTHRAPLVEAVEGCTSCAHFEGGLDGKIIEKGPLSGAKLKASYAGTYQSITGVPISCCPPPALPPSGHFELVIEGAAVLKQCAPPLE